MTTATLKKGKTAKVQPKSDNSVKIPDFTDRAIKNSGSKRILFLNAISKLKIPQKGIKITIGKLIDREYVANSLLRKVSRHMGDKIRIKATRTEDVGKKDMGVVEVEITKL